MQVFFFHKAPFLGMRDIHFFTWYPVIKLIMVGLCRLSKKVNTLGHLHEDTNEILLTLELKVSYVCDQVLSYF